MGAELGAPSGDLGAERVGEKLRAEADGETRQTAPHGIAKPAAGVERHVVYVQTATEHDCAVELVDDRERLVRFEHVVLDACRVEGAGESAEPSLRLVLKDGQAQRLARCEVFPFSLRRQRWSRLSHRFHAASSTKSV